MRNSFLGLWLALALSASGAEIQINFSDFTAGQSPTNFHNALAGTGHPGDWKIVTDESPSAFTPLMPQITPTAPAVRRPVLAQLSRDPTDEHFPMLIYDGATFKNFKLTTEFKIVGGVAEQMAGVVFRFDNASNFYVLRASALGHNVRLYPVVNGVRGGFIGQDVDISTNIWHTLVVECSGNKIDCELDGKSAMKLIDNQIVNTVGKIGFWTKSDAVSYFGNTTIDYTPLILPAQALVESILKKEPRLVGLRIYMPDDAGQMHIVASKVESEIGQPGTDAEKNAFVNGTISIGHGKHTVMVDMPLNDRNGDPVAAVQVELKSYSLAETQDMVLDRARIIVNLMEAQVLSKDDLMQ